MGLARHVNRRPDPQFPHQGIVLLLYLFYQMLLPILVCLRNEQSSYDLQILPRRLAYGSVESGLKRMPLLNSRPILTKNGIFDLTSNFLKIQGIRLTDSNQPSLKPYTLSKPWPLTIGLQLSGAIGTSLETAYQPSGRSSRTRIGSWFSNILYLTGAS